MLMIEDLNAAVIANRRQERSLCAAAINATAYRIIYQASGGKPQRQPITIEGRGEQARHRQQIASQISVNSDGLNSSRQIVPV